MARVIIINGIRVGVYEWIRIIDPSMKTEPRARHFSQPGHLKNFIIQQKGSKVEVVSIGRYRFEKPLQLPINQISFDKSGCAQILIPEFEQEMKMAGSITNWGEIRNQEQTPVFNKYSTILISSKVIDLNQWRNQQANQQANI